MSGRDGGGDVGRHLGEEDLSELVDGLAPPDAMTHVAACRSCQARLDQWRATAAGLRSPVAPPPRRREEAVAAALAVVGAEVDRQGGEAGSGGSGRSGRASGRPGGRGRAVAGLAAAAAVVVAAGVGLSQLHGSARSSSRTASGGTAAAGSAGAGNAPARSRAGGALPSLGSLDGTPALVAAVDRALPPSGAASAGAQSNGGAAAVTAPSASAGGAGGSTASTTPAGSVAGPGAVRPVAEPAASSPFAAAPTVVTPTTAPGSCPVPAQLFPSGSQPQLLLEATAEYRRAPAEVFVFQVGAGRQAVVVATAGCAVLAQAAV